MKRLYFKTKIWKIFIFFIVVCGFCLNPKIGYSEEISFEATIDRDNIEIGSTFRLRLTTRGTQSTAAVQLPNFDGFESQYLATSSRSFNDNGEKSQSTTTIYNLYPTKVGIFQIPSFTATINGRGYSTKPITVNVVAVGTTHSPGAQKGKTKSNSLSDRIFVVMGLPKNTVYLNEQIPVTIRLFVNNVPVEYYHDPIFEHVGFSLGKYKKEKGYQQTINGIAYQVVEFKIFVSPTRIGDLTLGPTKQKCLIVFKQQSRRDDLISRFFDTSVRRNVILESSELNVKILPLPEEGKPKDFSGAVGEFDFTASVNPATIKVGDPVTVRMRVSNEGSLSAVTMPAFSKKEENEQNFKFYDPIISEVAGAKVLEQVIIPTTEKVKELPEINFSYFDTIENRYKTITRGPFPLSVTALAEGEELKVVGLSREKVLRGLMSKESLGQGIVFIKDHPGSFQPIGFQLYKNPIFLSVLGILIFAWAMFLAAYHFTHKIKTDVKFARRLQAPQHFFP